MAPVDSDVIGAEFDLTIASGRSLVAKDGSGFLGLGKAKTSDPYVKIIVGGRALAETNVCKKTLSPEWNQTFKLHLDGRAYRPREALILAVFDHDRTSSDDPMGEVRLPLESLQGGQVMDKWYKVENCRGCNDASGELRIRVSCLLRHALSLEARQTAPLPRSTGTVAVGLGWDPYSGRPRSNPLTRQPAASRGIVRCGGVLGRRRKTSRHPRACVASRAAGCRATVRSTSMLRASRWTSAGA